jgi:PAS domain S-box-containing protein
MQLREDNFESALLLKNAKFADYFKLHPEPTLVIDPIDNRIIEANNAACRFLELSRNKLLSITATSIHPHDYPELLVFTESVLHKGRGWTSSLTCKTCSNDRTPLEYHAHCIHANNKPLIIASFHAKKALETLRSNDDADDYVRRGLSEWKRIESIFKEIEKENQLILKAAGDGIYGVNAEGVTTFVNPAALDILGFSNEELVGENMHELVHHSHADGSHYDHIECPIYAAFRDGVVHRVEDEIFWRKDGIAIAVEYTSTPILDNGKPVGAVITFRDISQRKQAEAELHKALKEVQQLKQQLEEENAYLQEEIRQENDYKEIVGISNAVRNVFRQIEMVAKTDSTVMIHGDSGTGKELIARAIHKNSVRADKPLIRVNCAAIPHDLFESEFFGHIKGAFTGAVRDRSGRFQLADGGTLFLDEIGEIPIDLQSKLLRVLQEGQFERIGEATTRTVDVRLIVATNRNLPEEIRHKRFREDLYFRLNVFPIKSSPLKERPEDIPLLASHFMQRLCRKMDIRNIRLTKGDVNKLQAYHWPGNVRELENVIERAIISSQQGRLNIEIPQTNIIEKISENAKKQDALSDTNHKPILTEAERRQQDKQIIIEALKQANGKVYGPGGAAEILGLKATTLSSRMKKLNIHKPKRGQL